LRKSVVERFAALTRKRELLGASPLRRPIFSICDPIQHDILLVGANGCSPEEWKPSHRRKAEGKK
ncbi:MAG: hypothetical protein ACP5FY_09240, partial [Kosmotogaceae bacterium]